jgi:uncharacterized membrane protein
MRPCLNFLRAAIMGCAALAAVWSLSPSSAMDRVSTAAAEAPAREIDFPKEILPILEEKCIRCHGTKRRAGKLDMRTIQAMLDGGDSGPAFKPGDAKQSLMIEMIHYKEMPPKKEEPRVTPEELDLLRAWIDAMQP